MNERARITYHADLWPAACKAQRWNHRDQQKRRHVVLDCMRQVRGPQVTTSDPRFRSDETTALFTFLRFLARQDSLEASAAWDECKRDYKAYNRARNADWHERETYGEAGSKRLQKERFARRKTAAGEPLDSVDPEETRKRHITMASRHRAKLAKQKKANIPRTRAEQQRLVPAAGSVIALPPPAAAVCDEEPELVEAYAGEEPAYVAPEDQPF